MALSSFTVTVITKSDSPFNIIENAPIEIRERLANGSSGGLSLIFSDSAGTVPITQTGATADSNGQFSFFAAASEYNAVFNNGVTTVTQPIDVGITSSALNSALINDLSQAYTFKTAALMQASLIIFPVGKKIFWQGYNLESDGGSNWGIVKSGAHTPADGSIFTLADGKYVQANLIGQVINVRKFGATGAGIVDDYPPINAALSFLVANMRKVLYLPDGTYLMATTLREATNGFALEIRGESRLATVLKAAPGLTGPVIWLGNSNGHGNYRLHIYNFEIDCDDKTDPTRIAIRPHEAGTSRIHDMYITRAFKAIENVGVIGSVIDGMVEIIDCTQGIDYLVPVAGTPSGPDDITTTASPLTLHSNIDKIHNVWFSGMVNEAVIIRGGLTQLIGCTFQGCGQDPDRDVVLLENANESKDFGGGPLIKGNWFEGGTYRHAISSRNTRAPRIKDNFISGANSALGLNEGAVLIDDSQNAIVTGNSIRGFFDATPTQGRPANGGGIFVAANSGQNYKVEDNFLTKNTVNNYFEGDTAPTLNKSLTPIAWVYVSISGTTPTIENSRNITSVVRVGLGTYTITLGFNRESTDVPSIATPVGASKIFTVTEIDIGAANAERFIFADVATGQQDDPDGFSVLFFGEAVLLA